MKLGENSRVSQSAEKKAFSSFFRLFTNCRRSSPTDSFAIAAKSRRELLTARKIRLREIADSAPDVIVVNACLIYLKAYFGTEREMICALIKNSARWQMQNLRVKTELRLERFYYRFVKGFSEHQWQAKLRAETENSVAGHDL